jgi:hypothetical protein
VILLFLEERKRKDTQTEIKQKKGGKDKRK